MTTFEDKLCASVHRLATQDNKRMHVPQNPLQQKRTYWGWVATPAAAIVGLVLGLSVHTFMDSGPDIQYVHLTDTLCIPRPVHDTLYLTQVVEKEKIIVRPLTEASRADSDSTQEEAELSGALVSDTEPTCTSIQCDGINYAILASR